MVAASKISPQLPEAPLMVALRSLSSLKQFLLPDVLSGPGLDHDPHLKLLCALGYDRRGSAERGVLQSMNKQRDRQCLGTYILRLP